MKTSRILLVVLLAAGLLRLVTLDERSLWIDEATSIQVSSQPVATIMAGDAFDNHTPPLYYLLLNLWWVLFPKTEFWLRLPSLLLDLVNVALVARVFGRQFSERVGLTAASFYAVSAYAIYYGQEGRMYTLAPFFALAAYASALRFREETAPPWAWIAGWLAAVGGLYTHYYNALFLVALTVALTVDLWPDRRKLLRWYGVVLAAGVAFLPWLNVVLDLMGQGGQTFRRFVWPVPAYTFFRWVAGYAIFPLNYRSLDDPVASLIEQAPTVAVYLGVFGAVSWLGLRRLVSEHRSELVMVTAPLIVPAILGLGVSLSMPMLSERYLVVSFPFFAVVLALAFVSGQGRSAPRSLLVTSVVLVLLALGAHFLSRGFGHTQWRQSLSYVRTQTGTARIVYAYPHWTREVVGFYAAPDLEVRPLDAHALEGLTEGAPGSEPDGRPSRWWLLERANMPSLLDRLTGSGYAVTHQEILPLRSGVRVFHLERPDPGEGENR